MKNVIYLLIAFAISASSCRKDIELEKPAIILVGEDVTTYLHGRIVDPNGRSIAEAEVTVEERAVFTNIDGYFYFPDITVPNDGFAIKVISQSNDRTIRRLRPQAESNTYEEIILKNNIRFIEYESGQDNIVSDSFDRVRVTIPANSLVDANNNSYQGLYRAGIKYFNPTDTRILKEMPGNLQGIDKNGDKVTLGSYGMFEIMVIGENGENLELTKGQSASVRLSVPATLATNAIETVPIWKIDADSGLWVESGSENTLVRIEDVVFYGFDINEFNFWNCDIKELNTSLSGTVLDKSGVPIENRVIQITFESDGNNFFCSGGNTNNRGEFETRVPKRKVISLSLYDQNCGKLIHTEELGPYTADINTEDIVTLITEETYTISGRLFDCEELPLGNATVFLYGANEQVRANTQTIADGSFTIHNICFGDEFSLKVLNLNTLSSFFIGDFPFAEIDFDVGDYFECEETSEFINVNSGFEPISFDNPEGLYEGDSLVISAETAFGDFLLVAEVTPDGNNSVSLINIAVGDQQLTCTTQFSHTKCDDAVSLNITEINSDLRFITGDINGVLYMGDISSPDSTIASDVTIIFRVNY